MPTKTNDSPLQTNGLLAGLASKAIGFAGGKIGGVVGKGLIKGAAKANPLGAAITGAQALFGGIKEVAQDRREAKDAGVKYGLFEGIKDFSAGALKGATGIDLTDQDVYEQPEYTTNIDPMTGQEIPLTMTGKQKPLKALTQMQGTTAYNMSAAQYKSALKMKEISGAATMPEKSDIKMEDLSGDGKVTMKDVLIGRGVIDKEGNKNK